MKVWKPVCLGVWLTLRFKSIYCQCRNVRKPWRLQQLMAFTVGFAQQLNFWERMERKAQQPREGMVLGTKGSQELPAQPWGGPICGWIYFVGTRQQAPQAASMPEGGQILDKADFLSFSLSQVWYSSCRFYSKRARTQEMATCKVP